MKQIIDFTQIYFQKNQSLAAEAVMLLYLLKSVGKATVLQENNLSKTILSLEKKRLQLSLLAIDCAFAKIVVVQVRNSTNLKFEFTPLEFLVATAFACGKARVITH